MSPNDLGSLLIWSGCAREEREGRSDRCDFSSMQGSMQRCNLILAELHTVLLIYCSACSCLHKTFFFQTPSSS